MVDRILRRMCRVSEYFCGFMLALMVFVICYVVLMRYVFNNSPIWGEELARMCMVYLCFYGFNVGTHHNTNIRLTMFDKYLPKFLLRISDYVVLSVIMAISIFLFVQGIRFTIIGHGNMITGMQVPASVLMSCVPIGAFLNIFQVIYRLRRVE